MIGSHLPDEAVAAFADGVLRGHARARAARHVDTCVECQQAVRAQREAVLALRRAPAPSLPAGLFERLQDLHGGATLPPPPEPARPSFPALAPLAAFVVPEQRVHPVDEDAVAELPADHPQRGMWGLAALFTAKARRRG